MEILRNTNQLYNLLIKLFKLENIEEKNKAENGDFSTEKDGNVFESENEFLDEVNQSGKFNFFDNNVNDVDRNPKDNNDIFQATTKDFLQQNNFVLKIVDRQIIKTLSNHIKKIDFNANEIAKLSNLIFQLNNFVPLLCNIVQLFLSAHKFEEIFVIVSKIFVAHIGNKVYRSMRSTTFAERNFDRFIEIIEYGNIESSLYLPFLIAIHKNDRTKNYFVWKNPALEYLQNFWNRQSEDELKDFINNNIENKYTALSAVLEFNTAKGVEFLIDDFISKSEFIEESNEQATNLMKFYKREVLLFIDHEISQVKPERQEKLVEVLFSLAQDDEVKLRIEHILKNTENQNIKELISEHMGISEKLNKKTEKQFLNAVRREIKESQHRVLGIPFDKFNLKFISEYPADDAVYTYLINIFKDDKKLVNLPKTLVLYKIFEKDSLNEFVKKIFEILIMKEDVNQAKWALRMSAFLGDAELDSRIYDFILKLSREFRYKECKYLILCMIYSKKQGIINVLKCLVEEKNEFIIENLSDFINLISNNCDIEIEEIKDILITDNYDEQIYENEKERLFNAFICGRFYKPETFKNLFIENRLFNKLGQNLVFGEYWLGKLQNAFIIENKTPKFLVGESLKEREETSEKDILKNGKSSIENAEIYIGIIHPLDYDYKYEQISDYFKNPTFNQFKKPKIQLNEFSASCISVGKFIGIIVDPQKFCSKLFQHNFIPNKLDTENEFKSLVHIMPSINLICEVEFDQVIHPRVSHASLGNVYFYKLGKTLCAGQKYITQNSNAVNVNVVPYRYLDYIIGSIHDATKNTRNT